MTDAIRRRNPFKFVQDDEVEDTHVLDEQEQEELIESLKKENEQNTERHYKFLQGCLTFTILFQFWFLVSPRLTTPLHILLPYTRRPLPDPIPLSTIFTVGNILLLLNATLHLPPSLSFSRFLRSILAALQARFPHHAQHRASASIPLSLNSTVYLLCIPPLLAVLVTADAVQIIWWSFPVFVVGINILVLFWIAEMQQDIGSLEKMKYVAKGA